MYNLKAYLFSEIKSMAYVHFSKQSFNSNFKAG